MYEGGVNLEGAVNHNLLFCHACLNSNRTLTSVGEYVDIYIKICENSRMTQLSQINICWECMALLKKVRVFQKKVETAQKILDYSLYNQAPLEVNLSNLTMTRPEVFCTNSTNSTLDEDEYEDDLDKSFKMEPEEAWDNKDQLMCKIEDVRGCCEILDSELSSSPQTNESEQRRGRWKRSVLLVYKRICGHMYARHFLRPVSDELAPQYSRIVRRPADLSSIRRRVTSGLIRTTEELRHALLLMFANALMYNSSDHDIYRMTLELRQETLRELDILSAAQAHAESPLARPPPPTLRRDGRVPSPPPPTPPPASPPRRAADWPRPPSPLARPPPHRRRSEWDWPDTELLIAVKKCKSSVLL